MNRVAAIVFVTFIGALTVRGAGSAPQVIPTSGAPPGPRTGLIVGQVVDSTGAPVPDAIVQMSMPKYYTDLPTSPKGRVMADDEGRFFFSDLPAGDYYLRANKEGYGGGEYGQRRAGGDLQLFSLTEGERRADAKLTLWKYAVIGGRVVDEAGEPVIGVAVRALIKDVVAGRAQFGSVSYLVPTTTTDDRGMFRMPRVPPGTYAVVAPSMHTTLPLSVMNAMDAGPLRTELFWAGVYESVPLGQPRTQQVGDFALMSLSTVLIPPPASPAGRMEAYRTTYFPSATTAREALPIMVGAGEERTDVAITLRPVPAMRVSGRLATPDGSTPRPTTIRLIGASMSDIVTESRPSSSAEVGFETATGMSDATGRFTLLGVPPGEYVLTHADSFLSRATREGRPAYWISQRISVGNEDLQNLVVDLRRALRVEGHVEFLGPNGPQSVAPAATLLGVAFETPFAEPGQFYAEVNRDATLSFSTVAAGGQYIARPHETSGWFVKSVTLDGKDITDRVFELQADATNIVVTYTDRASKVSGTVKDANGTVSPNARVLAFPVDPQKWVGYGRSPRNIRGVATYANGTYTFNHLPPGEYCVIAIDDAATDGWADPKALQMLAGRAEKLTVAAGDAARKLDLTVRTVR